jgi:RNA-directed DNA polymerase
MIGLVTAQVASLGTLRAALRAAYSRPRYQRLLGGALTTRAEQTQFVLRLQHEIRSEVYAPLQPTIATVPHPTHRLEVIRIHQLGPREWVVERAIRSVLSRLYEPVFSATSCAYRRNKGERELYRLVSTAQHDGFIWIACADVAQFFRAVDVARLLREIGSFTGDPSLSSLIGVCIFQQHNNGLPLGHVLSPFLSNVYMHPIDMLPELRPLIRYADDCFLPRRTAEEAVAALTVLQNAFAVRGLVMHPQKRRVLYLPNPSRLLKWGYEDIAC